MPTEVEQVLQKLRPHFPGKADQQIVQVLRGYVTHDGSKEKDEVRWLAERLERAKKQTEAVNTTKLIGGFVTYDYMLDPSDHACLLAHPQAPGPDWLRTMLGEDFIADAVRVNFDSTNVSNAQLRYLEGLPQLRWVNLFSTQITDEGLVYLRGLKHLQRLELGGSKVTDAGLDHLRGLPELELVFAPVTEEGLDRLRQTCPRLISGR